MGGLSVGAELQQNLEQTAEDLKTKKNYDGALAVYDYLIANELDAEARHCFAFQPTVALIREAKRRGLNVIEACSIMSIGQNPYAI